MNRRNFIKFSAIATLTPRTFANTTGETYIKNHALKTIKDDYLGNKIKDNIFQNPYGKSGQKSFIDLLGWKFSENPQEGIKETEQYSLNVINDKSVLDDKKDFIYWLGHASFLIQIDNKKIITDPCLTSPPFVKRHTKLPIPIENLKPDYILATHGHFDHLDGDTVKHFDNSMALIPLGMSELIKDMNPSITTQEAGWFQQYDIAEDFKVFFLPSHHWHRRTLFDTDKILWGSFIIQSKNKTIYFAGDSAYSEHFKEIGELFDIDIAILPIGAYSPDYMMKSSHINPNEAFKAYKDLKAKKLIPMHFGTFDISDEPMSEPEFLMKKLSKNINIQFLDIGEKDLLS